MYVFEGIFRYKTKPIRFIFIRNDRKLKPYPEENLFGFVAYQPLRVIQWQIHFYT